MPTLRKIAFLLEEFIPGSPAQHILDRFLMGYPRNGRWQTPEIKEVAACLMPGSDADFGTRAEDFELRLVTTAEQAVEGAEAVVIVPRRPGAMANDRFLRIALERAAADARCFVYGALSTTRESGEALLKLAASRRISVLAGTTLGVTWRLPQVDLTPGTPLAEALIVVQSDPAMTKDPLPSAPSAFTGAELNALEGLIPVIERRAGGERGVQRVQLLEGAEVWRAGTRGLWSRELLAAAISRSDSPLGDAVLDGRTQDLIGLGLVPKLAQNPRAWLIEHRDGLRSALLVLDGVLNDFNFAVRPRQGPVLSAQLLRPPPPLQHHFSQLTAVMEDFLAGGPTPWPVQRNLLIAGLLEAFRNPATRNGRPLETPGLALAGSASS